MKRGVVKVTACCLAGSVIFASTGLTAFAAGEMPLAGIGAEIISKSGKEGKFWNKKSDRNRLRQSGNCSG